jgi:branched-chain amino acid transport system permease protein
MGHVPGVILGVAMLTILPEALRYLGEFQMAVFGRIHADPADLRMLIFGIALVTVMLFRPAGLWPSARREHELVSETEPSLYDTSR